jgi:hypothetical protein
MNFDPKKIHTVFSQILGTLVASIKKERFFSIRIFSKKEHQKQAKTFFIFSS